MLNKPEDRRTRRTKRMLKQGLAELMQEKDFNSITVRDITDRMDLNRGTFYLHYADTYDLLQKLESDTINDVQNMIDEHYSETNCGTLQPVFEPILNYIVENRDICYSLFVNNTTSNFIDKIHQLIYENGESLLKQRFPDISKEKAEYFFSFITYGLIGLIKHWFDTNMSMNKNMLINMANVIVTSSAKILME